MALLLIELDKRIGNAQQWRDTFAEQLPDLPVRIWPDNGDVKEVEYLAFMHPDFDAIPHLPNLKAMFSQRKVLRCGWTLRQSSFSTATSGSWRTLRGARFFA